MVEQRRIVCRNCAQQNEDLALEGSFRAVFYSKQPPRSLLKVIFRSYAAGGPDSAAAGLVRTRQLAPLPSKDNLETSGQGEMHLVLTS
jgi:hypothetical protein